MSLPSRCAGFIDGVIKVELSGHRSVHKTAVPALAEIDKVEPTLH